MRKIKVTIEVEIPDNASHYAGHIDEGTDFYKCTQVGGFDHWWSWYTIRNEWVLHGHSKPNWAKEISEVEL